ncbi:hypothetical protein ACIQXD_34800 [Streptomyces uncialis]|uniref:hypothetical protein n=1 Tax=Streptomyces uncialis TaxID=1048205 RepID=UPI00381057B4
MNNASAFPADRDPDEIAELGELQTEIAGLLLRHVQAPLIDDQHVRGVLPSPDGAEAVRVVTGRTGQFDRLTAYEVPLRATGGDLRTSHSVVALLRARLTAAADFPGPPGTVMGMPLVHIDPETVDEAPFTKDDWVETLLSTLAHPEHHDRPHAQLRGYLFRAPDRLRLYLDTLRTTGVIAVDVRPGGALTALLAMLSTFDEEEWRSSTNADDPHASQVFDYTDL